MAGAFRRVMVYLGLVDDEYEEYESYEDPQPPAPVRRVQSTYAPEPEVAVGSVRTVREPDPMSGISIQPRTAVVRPIQPVQNAKVHIVTPASFDAAKEIGERLKDNQPVIVNLQDVDIDLGHRITDFCSGAVFVLGAHMEKAANKVFLITPSNVEVSQDEKRRLQERGLYRA